MRRAIIVVLALAGLWAGGAFASAGAPLRVERQGKDVYLVKGSARLLLERDGEWVAGRGQQEFAVAGGRTLGFTPKGVVLRKGSQVQSTLLLPDLLRKWLADDAVWGGHAPANEMRYMHRSAGGISGSIGSGAPVGKHVLAILTWCADGPSGRPVSTQYLVRVRALPTIQIQPLRELDVPGGWLYGLSSDPPPRLFRFGPRVLLLTGLDAPYDSYRRTGTRGKPLPPAVLSEIGPDGKALRVFAQIPARAYPIGVLGGRYLVLGVPNDKERNPLSFLDLAKRRRTVLPGDWQGYASAGYVYVPQKGGRILILRITGGPSSHTSSSGAQTPALKYTTYVVSIPSGRRVALPNPDGTTRQVLWQGLAVILGGQGEASVYSARTGKLVQRLQIGKP